MKNKTNSTNEAKAKEGTMMTTKETAAQMRKEYKALGLNSRKVSVRTEYYSMGSSIHVTVKDPSVDIAKAKEIAKNGEKIDRCEITHEILSGCNLFVHFGLSDEVEKALSSPYRPKVDAALAKLQKGENGTLVRVEGTSCMIGKATWEDSARLWIGDSAGMEYDLKYGLDRMALDVAIAEK